jgi:hypothetical protein
MAAQSSKFPQSGPMHASMMQNRYQLILSRDE